MTTTHFIIDVQIFDTDCYGVMWHGSYTKWLEQGRVHFLETLGLSLKQLWETQDMVFPVAQQSVRFKSSAVLEDTLMFETSVQLQAPRLVFHQRASIIDKATRLNAHPTIIRRTIEAETTVVVTSKAGKLYRKMPDTLLKALEGHEESAAAIV